MTLKSINPTTGKLNNEYDEWDKNKVDQQVDRSYSAYNQWREIDFDEKKKLFRNISRILKNNSLKFG